MTRIVRPADGIRRADVLHADLDSFYASVEQRDEPRLRGRPVAVGGGIVLAASYEAKRFGVHAPMNERRARRLCPDLVVVPPRFEAYVEASRAVFEVFDDVTPVVEGLSIDEAFLDVSGLRRLAGEPVAIAAGLRAAVRERVGLAITVGVARTKFLAKVASAVGKPDGLVVVDPDREVEFLHPLPVGRLWGVGPVTERVLREHGFVTVGDVAAVGEDALVALVGAAAGRHLHALARLRDPRPVEVGRRRRSIGSQCALGRSAVTDAAAEALLLGIVDRVTRRLRNGHRLGTTVTLRLRFGDYTRATRSRTLAHATAATEPIGQVAVALLRAALPLVHERGLTLIGMSLGNLVDERAAPEQLLLPLRGRDRSTLDGTLDDLRRRFGSAAVTRASLLRRRVGFEAPQLPD
jgi:DNA polymerase-4